MKILIEESVLRQALDYTERVCGDRCNAEYNPCEARDIAAALRTAIEAAEKQEPVAWMGEYNINNIRDHYTVVMRNKTDFDKLPERLRPLYTTPQPAIPAGYALVPVEPTPEMMAAAGWHSIIIDGYKSMLAAAPKPENSHD